MVLNPKNKKTERTAVNFLRDETANASLTLQDTSQISRRSFEW
jgi:hypothetical protein